MTKYNNGLVQSGSSTLPVAIEGNSKPTIHIVGFGSQASAWSQCLKRSGWNVQVYTSRKGPSFDSALQLGYSPLLVSNLPESLKSQAGSTHWIATLCPDSVIPHVYEEWISRCPDPVRLILAHGYAVYSSELQFRNPNHQATLLAPKAIGPKLLQNFQNSFPNPHSLVAAFFASSLEDQHHLTQIARGMGFAPKNLVSATFDQETIGDLISEQGLLCGGVFNLLLWTMEEMAKAGIPDELIREECLSELELIAGLIRERGPAGTFRAISQAAQCGTIAMAERLAETDLKQRFKNQAESVRNREFPRYMNSSQWKTSAAEFLKKLESWEIRLRKESSV